MESPVLTSAKPREHR